MVTKGKKREEKTRSLIIAALTKSDAGLSISEMSRLLSMHYTTVSKYAAVLEAEGKIIHKEFGMAKVFRISKKEAAK
jgi:hypothetical protein